LDLDFDQEQALLRQTVRDVLGRHCPLDVVRQMEDDPTGYPLPLWAQLGELDLIGLLLPEAYGGSGMSLIEGVALYEEFGRALAPTPHFVSAVMCGGVLAAVTIRNPARAARGKPSDEPDSEAVSGLHCALDAPPLRPEPGPVRPAAGPVASGS